MKLFDPLPIMSPLHRRENEDTYSFLLRTSHPIFARMRMVFEKWFSNIPNPDDQYDLKQMIKNDFDAGFLELLLHELFLRQGFEVEFHPTLKNTNKSPDFRVLTSKGSFLIEAKCISEYSDNLRSLVTLRENLFDTLDTVPSPKYVFEVKVLEIKQRRSPSYNKIKVSLRSAMKEVQYSEVEKRAYANRNIYRYKADFEYEDENALIKINFIPRSGDYEEGKSRNLALWGGITRRIDHEPIIRKAIRRKAQKYRDLDEPYLIVVNALNRHAQLPGDFRNALFGQASMEEVVQNKPLSNHTGVLFNHSGAQYSNVSGVMGFRMNQNMIHLCNHYFYTNPNAKRPLPDLPLVRHDLDNNVLNEDSGKSIKATLNVGEDWLKME